VSAIDLLAGSNAALAVLLALRDRDHSGRGQRVDVSLYDTALYLMSSVIAEFTATGNVPGRPGRYYPLMAPAAVFKASDGEIVVMMSSNRHFESFCGAIRRQDLVHDCRFSTPPSRLEHAPQLYQILDSVFSTRTVAEWGRLCAEFGVPASEVNTVDDVVRQAHAATRDMIVDSGVNGIQTAGVPFKLSRSAGTVRRSAPRLGADSEYITASQRLSGD
jgi:crotonobetainyl-CoA:carnitine CoA-transferase CaiB-like acyl-CoA transferase